MNRDNVRSNVPHCPDLKKQWTAKTDPSDYSGTATFTLGQAEFKVELAHVDQFFDLCSLLDLVAEQVKTDEKDHIYGKILKILE